MAVIPPVRLAAAILEAELNTPPRHSAELKFNTRNGVEFILSLRLDKILEILPTEKYVKKLEVKRHVSDGSSLTISLSNLMPADLVAKMIPIFEGTAKFSSDLVTWKTILRTGSLVQVYINEEFKGNFLVSGVARSTDPTSVGYEVSCIGMQEFLRRQNLFFHMGNEPGVFSIMAALADGDPDKVTSSPKDAIQLIIEEFCFNTLDAGNFRFANNKSITDYISFALSDISFYGLNFILMQNFSPMSDWNVWENVMKYQSPPFHEIWVTNGGRLINLANGVTQQLADDIEYVVFRPTPYDDIFLEGPPPTPLQATAPGSEIPLNLHDVNYSLLWSGNAILDYHVKDTNLRVDDKNAFSYYNIIISGLGMDANSSSMLFPPLVDMEAMRYLGKVVFNAYFAGLDMSDWTNVDPRYHNMLITGKTLQMKAYNWFKYNSEFHKGTMRIMWIEGLSEGEHIWYQSEAQPEEAGYYYINGYTLRFDVEAATVEYTLDVTRGTPIEGFHDRIAPFPLPLAIPTGIE